MTDLIDTILTSNLTLFGIVLTAFFVFFQIQYAKYSKDIISIMFRSTEFIIYLIISFFSIAFGIIILYKLHTLGTDLLPFIRISNHLFSVITKWFSLISTFGLIVQIILLLILLFRNTFFLDIKNIAVKKIKNMKRKDIAEFIFIQYPLQEQLIINTGISEIRTYPKEEEDEIELIRQKFSNKRKTNPFLGILNLLDISIKDQNLESSQEIIDELLNKLDLVLKNYSDSNDYTISLREHLKKSLINYFNTWISNTISQEKELSLTAILSLNYFQDKLIMPLINERDNSEAIKVLTIKRDLLEKTWFNTFTTNIIIDSYQSIYDKCHEDEENHKEELLEVQRDLAYIFDIKINAQQVSRKSLMYTTSEPETSYGKLFNLICKILDNCSERPKQNHHVALDSAFICVNRLIKISTPENDFLDNAYTLIHDEFRIAKATALDTHGEQQNISSFIWDAIQLLEVSEEQGFCSFAQNIFHLIFELSLLIAQEIKPEEIIGNMDMRSELRKIIDKKYTLYGTTLFNRNAHEWETLRFNYNKETKADQEFWDYLSSKGPYKI